MHLYFDWRQKLFAVVKKRDFLNKIAEFTEHSNSKERINRTRYIALYLFWLFMIFIVHQTSKFMPEDWIFVQLALYISFIISLIVLQGRRMNDFGASRWWILASLFIPIIGVLIPLLCFLIPGEKFKNKYGPIPRAAEKIHFVVIYSLLLLFMIIGALKYSIDDRKNWMEYEVPGHQISFPDEAEEIHGLVSGFPFTSYEYNSETYNLRIVTVVYKDFSKKLKIKMLKSMGADHSLLDILWTGQKRYVRSVLLYDQENELTPKIVNTFEDKFISNHSLLGRSVRLSATSTVNNKKFNFDVYAKTYIDKARGIYYLVSANYIPKNGHNIPEDVTHFMSSFRPSQKQLETAELLRKPEYLPVLDNRPWP